MPRSLAGLYSLPSGSIVATGDDILPTQHNTPLQDLASDANLERPIVAGGTGATTASAARTNLGLEIGADVQAQEFKTVADLLASTSATLGATGDIVNAGGYRYEIVTTGEHLTTAGGVKLCARPSAANTLDPEQFGVSSGFLLHPSTRTVFNAIVASHTVRDAYLWLLERTIRDFIRADIWSNVSYTIGTGGLISWSQAGSDARELWAYNYIKGEYDRESTGIISLGNAVTAADLDAANAIDATANSTAMQLFLDELSSTGATGVIGPYDYPIGATMRAYRGVTINATNRTRFRMAASVGYGHPVFQTGDTDEPATRVKITGWPIFDGYYDQRIAAGAGSTGLPTNTDIRGSAVSVAYTSDSEFEVECWDAYKHAFSTDGGTNSRSGTPYSYPTYTQTCRNLVLDVRARGFGDDGVTTHQSDNIHIRNSFAIFARGTITSNGNGLEIDDASTRVNVDNATSLFCYGGLEIKGHSDARAADRISVKRILAQHCTNGAVVRHIDHGDAGSGEPASPSAITAGIGSLEIREPVAWTAGTERYALRAYSYKDVLVGSVSVYQGGSDADYYGTDSAVSDGVIQVINGQDSIHIGAIHINGFKDSIAGLRVTSSTNGPVTVGSLVTENGPLRGVHHSGGARVSIATADLSRTLDLGVPTVGSIAVRGESNLTEIGGLRAEGFEKIASQMTNQRNAVGGLVVDTDDLNDIGGGTLHEDDHFNATYTWSTSLVPANAPQSGGAHTCQMEHMQRTSASRTQIVYQSGNDGNETWIRNYTTGAWKPWYKFDVTAENGTVSVTSSTYTVLATDRYIKVNRAGPVTITLPAASEEVGRRIELTTQDQMVTSASADIVQGHTATAGAMILPPFPGANCVLVSNGTNWMAEASSHPNGSTGRIGQVNTAVSHTGSVTETTLGTIVCPAGALGPNGDLVIKGNASFTNNANSKTFRLKINGTTVVSLTSIVTSQASLRFSFEMTNRNSVSAQISSGSSATSGISGGQSTVANASYTFNTDADLTITVTGELSNSADAVTLEEWQVIATRVA